MGFILAEHPNVSRDKKKQTIATLKSIHDFPSFLINFDRWYDINMKNGIQWVKRSLQVIFFKFSVVNFRRK